MHDAPTVRDTDVHGALAGTEAEQDGAVPPEEIVKGHPYQPDRYVELSQSELEELQPTDEKTIHSPSGDHAGDESMPRLTVNCAGLSSPITSL